MKLIGYTWILPISGKFLEIIDLVDEESGDLIDIPIYLSSEIPTTIITINQYSDYINNEESRNLRNKGYRLIPIYINESHLI